MDAPRPPRPLVSVVIPCYNQARFLGEAIESALRQSGGRVEVVVVDDGSTDGTAAVAARYPGIVHLRQANRGLAAARNAGLRASRGDLLVFLDADDRLLPVAVRAGLDCLARHPDAAFVSGDHRRIAADGAPIETPGAVPVGGDHYLALLRGNYVGMHAAVMYRREAIERAGGFDERLPACEDYDLYLRIAREHPAAQHREVVALYRWHDGNMSRDAGFMLETVLGVLAAQRPHLRGDPRRLRAYRDGIRTWKAYYGDLLIRRLRRRPAPDGAPGAARCAAALLRHAPLHLARRSLGRAAGLAAKGAARLLPAPIRGRVRPRPGGAPAAPPVGRVDLGDLRRTTPVSRVFGFDRGLPVDRYYIEGFLARNAGVVRGWTLEAGDDAYTRRFGGDRVTHRDVLHVAAGNPAATVVADLAAADHVPSDRFDCIILTQVLHLVYDLRAAVATLHRILAPGGVLLATVPGTSQIEDGEWGGTWYWSLTALSARRLLEEAFPPSHVTVETHGNVLAAVGFLHGLAAAEIGPGELDRHDPLYPVVVAARATKPLAP